MNHIVTIGRAFGSGGRELGRRLAELRQCAYYDQELIALIAQRTSLTEEYIQQVLEERPSPLLPITIGRSFYMRDDAIHQQAQSVYKEQSKLIRELAEKSDCIIVGRCADYILRDMHPLRLFVYADMESKMHRCREKGSPEENFSDKELRQHIQRVDKSRAAYYEFYTGFSWGDMQNFDLCINTSGKDIKAIAQVLAPLHM